MADFGKINLAALASHRIMEISVAGSTEKIKAIVIPIEKNHLHLSDKGNVYLDLVAYKMKEPSKDKDGAVTQTHLIKQSLPKEIREKMTKEELMAQPIMGSLLISEYNGYTEKPAVQDDTIAPNGEDDLPF